MFDRPFGPRSIANKVWYASVSPFAIGLVAFSFVMVAFGSTIYITSIPGMVVNDTPYVNSVIGATGADSSGDSDDGADGSSESGSLGVFFADSIDSFTQRYLDESNSLGAGAASITKSGLSVPVLDLGGGADEPDDPSQGDVPPDDNGGAVIPPDASGPTTPSEPETPSEPTEEEKQEMMIHDALVGAYNALPEYYEQVVDSYITFNNNHATASNKMSYWSAANKLKSAIKGTFMYVEGKGTINVPTTSKYYSKFVEIEALYDDLVLAQGVVVTAWYNNWWNRPYLDAIQAECPNGQSLHLLDFVARYPGAAL